MGKVTERIECALEEAFAGRRLLTRAFYNGRQIMDSAFAVRSAYLHGDGFVSLYGDDREREYDGMELGLAVELADMGEAQYRDERGMLVIYTLKKEKRNEKD